MTLKVIGAGYGRTGTMSLKLALDHLGFGPCYHMVEVFKNPQAPLWWIDAAEGRPDWEKIFAGYASTVDWPNATFYKELAEAYPDAKVILTERDPEAWFKSTQATIFANDIPEDATDPWMRMVGKVVADLFDRRMHDKDRLISVYQAHNARVREVIPAQRLLVYEVSQGWAPLCAFLGVAVPEGPMPKVNSTEEFQGRLAHQIAERAQPAAEPA
ncbi:MAG: hypothetical protein JWP49_1245 [Phenylobacterium sp.]|jgi:hypothetical protein|nr:hypothetical protein [Phenylobacterium sp.]